MSNDDEKFQSEIQVAFNIFTQNVYSIRANET